VEVPESLESVVWVIRIFCGRSRKSGITVLGCGRSRKSVIGGLGHTEILQTFQKVWNYCFGSYGDSVDVPENLESVFLVILRFWGRSRNLE
jgi:hypothetical protein